MNILGISAFYHDSAACLIQDGRIVAAAQEERFTRKRHDAGFPEQAIRFCLRQGNVRTGELDHVVFYEKPFLKFERLIETYLAFAPGGFMSFVKAMPVWIKQKFWLREAIAKELSFEKQILFVEHHESHAASAFLPSPFEEAAILTMDGAGEWVTSSFGIGRKNRFDLLKEIRFPHSLGLLYSAFTYYMGFRVNSGEYKVMGLAPYGEPRYKDLILSELIELKEDGSFLLNMKYFNYCAGLTMTNDRFHKLFGGAPRKPETRLTRREMDLARSIQDVAEEVVLRMVRHVRKATGMKNLCLAGGVALNCVVNGKIVEEKVFDRVWIQPAAGDAGGALGAALFVWHQYLENPRSAPEERDSMRGALLGPAFTDAEIERRLSQNGASFEKLSPSDIPEKIADLIAQEKVIGWFHGRMEFGPRALGARSIIGDARSPRMQEIMNLKIKFRESFRPFAPSVLTEKAGDYFDMEGDSDYMLLTAPVSEPLRCSLSPGEEALSGIDKLKAKRSLIPAVTHVDYSARVQTVNAATHGLYYETIKKFDQKYGCAVIINTSFNVRGEPIVCTPEEAYRCFMRTNIDYLLVGSFLLDKRKQKPLECDDDWRKRFRLD